MVKSTNCQSCGRQLDVDVFTGEARECPYCGPARTGNAALPGLDPNRRGGLIGTPNIPEIVLVIVIIIVGVLYINFGMDRSPSVSPDSLHGDMREIAEASGFFFDGTSTVHGRSLLSFRREMGTLRARVELASETEGGEVHTVIIAAGLPPGVPFPDDDVAQPAVQDAFNEMAVLGASLVPESTEALQEAAGAMQLAGEEGLTYRKGIAQTQNHWVITYIAYREYKEDGSAIPLLLFLYQKLDSASDPELEAFNRAIYAGITEGTDFTSAAVE